jgi:cysteinyl-tRNA synthetase
MSVLQIHNSLTKRKEEFKPLHEGQVGVYVCGPTVYGDAHLGHAKSYVSFDVVVRYLRHRGYKVRYVQNITDVGHLTDDADEGEDKILKRARIERVEPMELVERYTRSYFEDMDRLNVVRPDISPRASGHIIEQIELIERLIKKGYAYVVNGTVYFEVSRFANYGRLSGRRIEDAVAGTRVERQEGKRAAADFALWKRAEPSHLLQWRSPWGMGYPGWHIECSAMSMKYLGETFDIHGGGMENMFPHHEDEIAQSEGATGKPFVRYWMHNNMVTVGGQKMGKSLGNFITLKELFKKYEPPVIRFFILSSHYRSTLDFSDQALEAARTGFSRLLDTVKTLRKRIALAPSGALNDAMRMKTEALRKRFIEAIDDDFNTPEALAAIFDLAKETNILLGGAESGSLETLEGLDRLYRELGGDILGIVPETIEDRATDGILKSVVEILIGARQELREQKNFELADGIRRQLESAGIVLEDHPGGTEWKVKT